MTLESSSTALRRRLASPKLVITVAIAAFAFATHLFPYSISSYPFNNDGMTEARIADDIISAEHLEFPTDAFYYDTYSLIIPVYNVLLAFASSFLQASPFDISQMLAAIYSVVTVMTGYVIALRISRNVLGAVSAAMMLSLLGTFVYLSGSSWKASLGVAMLMLLTYAYINRSDKRYMALELLALATLPLIHHLVAVIALLMLAYLTCWSASLALARKSFNRTHMFDILVLGMASCASYAYYHESSFQRLSEFGTIELLVLISLLFLGLFTVAAFALTRKDRMRFSLAPAIGAAVAIFVYIDYSDPVFPYVQGFGMNMLILGLLYSIIVAVSWFGFERLTGSNSRFRAIPLGLLLPILTLFLFATFSGMDLESHKIIYRVFDFADISLAIGLSISMASLSGKRTRMIAAVCIMIVLVCTFPFAYLSGPLVGIRHDSQQYEIDGIAWVNAHVDPSFSLRSDERISYDAQALYDFGKNSYLPSMLLDGNLTGRRVINLYLEEWTTIGVNDYPRGHPILDVELVNSVLTSSNVMRVGGPASNSLITFQVSPLAPTTYQG